MANSTYLVSSSPFSQKAALNPNVTGGLLLAYFLLGLASYFWAFWSQRRRLHIFKESIILTFSNQQANLKGVQNVHTSLISLIFIDVLNVIAAIILIIEFFRSACSTYTCGYITIFWFLSRHYGVILHLLNVLACILFLCHTQWGAKLRCITVIVTLLIFIFIPVYIFYAQAAILGQSIIIIGITLAIIVKCATSGTPPSVSTHKKLVVMLGMMTFLLVFMPAFVLQCLMYISLNNEYAIVYQKVLFCTSFNIFLDGCLYYCILRLPSVEEEEQQQQQQQSGGNPNNVSVAVVS